MGENDTELIESWLAHTVDKESRRASVPFFAGHPQLAGNRAPTQPYITYLRRSTRPVRNGSNGCHHGWTGQRD